MFDVITFGGAVIDCFVNTDTKEKKDSICYPIGSKILVKDVKFDTGGGGTNTAVAFARLGLKTGSICKVGEDDNGKKILELLKKEKVKFLGTIDKNTSTGYSIILDSHEKNRTILTHRGASNEITLEELDPKKIKTKWLYCSAAMGKSLETQKELIHMLSKKRVRIALNPGAYLLRNKNINPLLELVDVLIVNKEEAQMLTRNKDLLFGLHYLGPDTVAITDKDNPIICYDDGKRYSMKTHKIRVVERTGAGDAFASGFVAGLIANKPTKDCLKIGLMNSENVIKHFGAKNRLLKFNIKKINRFVK